MRLYPLRGHAEVPAVLKLHASLQEGVSLQSCHGGCEVAPAGPDGPGAAGRTGLGNTPAARAPRGRAAEGPR